MFEVDTHKVAGDSVNHQVRVMVMDEPGPGGAHHEYIIEYQRAGENGNPDTVHKHRISFQNGPIAEAGINGITHEALLAIVNHRLEKFQEGPFRNQYSSLALDCGRNMLETLQARTRERIRRGVEGTHQK